MIRKFKKKPIVVEAMQIKQDEKVLTQLLEFCKPRRFSILGWVSSDKPIRAFIETLEGEHEAKVGDWIIKGVRGECYPCREDIFNETYDEVK